ncbi:MAG: hypothetical protein IJU45_01775 [Clostridia bacterium]|nr:hypothetical protein [Clostridia bacterium]
MKALKRIICVIMVFALIACSMSVAAYAKSEDEEIVANVYICHRVLKKVFQGHAWLYFENLTDHDIQVGAYTVEPGGSVSVGTYSGKDVPEGFGVYYNVEAYRYGKGKLDDNVYLKKELTQKQLERMSNKIARSNYWTHLTNCSFFSITTWDVVAGKPLIYLMIPILTRWQIQLYPGHEEGLILKFPGKDKVFKQKGLGKNAALVPTEPYK